MKKFLMLITAMLCVLCGALAFAACGETTTGNTGNGGTQTEQPGEQTPGGEEKPHIHSFVDYYYNEDATCTEDGTETGTCSCGETDTRTKENSALGHDFQVYTSNEDATCTENGTETATCTRCSEQDTREAKDSALGHDFQVYTSNEDATCFENGTETATCTRCSERDTREAQNSALGHEWDDGVVTPATCIKAGQKFYTCAHNPNHHKWEKIEIDPTAHSYGDWIPPTDAKCTKEGTLGHFQCKYCQQYFDSDYKPLNNPKIQKLPHEYNEWQEEIPTSCTAPGRKGYQECKNCHLKYDREGVLIEENDLTIAQLAHAYQFDHVQAKTCQDPCYVVNKCSMCQGTQNVTVEDISLKARLTKVAGASLSGYGSHQKTYAVYAQGGYGTLQYRFEFYQSSTDSPSRVLDFSEYNEVVLSYNGYDSASDGWTLKVICKDEAGNMTTALFNLKVNVSVFGSTEGFDTDLRCLEQMVDEGTHNYQGVKTDPTCTEQGYTTYTCSDCQKDYVGDYVDPLGHEYQNDVCIRCSRHTGLLYVPSGDHCVLVSIGTCTETEIVIAENYEGLPVTEIGERAFYDEDSVMSVKIPKSVTSIGDKAFRGCDKLESVTFEKDSNLISIRDDAFYECGKLTSIEIPKSVTSIGSSAFAGCSNLESVTFEKDSNLITIRDDAFYKCGKLTSIEIPKSVTSIGDDAFYHCDKLESVTFEKDSNLTTIESEAFAYCLNLICIEIPKSVTTIGRYAFNMASLSNRLKNVTFEANSSLTSIGAGAFRYCYNLTSIEIPKSVTSIGSSAFDGCSNLQSVTFEDPNGWSHGSTPIDPSLLQNTAVAAAYLSKTYCSETWKKTKEN